MKIISTEKSQVLASNLARMLEVGIATKEFRRFPDGEIYIKAGSLDDETIIVGSVVDSDSLVELLILIDACEGSEITLVIPYMGYARQDRKFNKGEPISARAVAKALSRGVARVFTINIHEESVLEHFDVPAENLSLAPEIGEYIRSLNLEKPLILSPDAGASAFAADVAATGGWDADYLQKTRLSGTEVRIAPKNLDASGRGVVIVDDIIATGGTQATASSMLLEQGATAVYAACVHGIFASGAYARLSGAGLAGIASSDTIESAASRISAAAIIAEAIRR